MAYFPHLAICHKYFNEQSVIRCCCHEPGDVTWPEPWVQPHTTSQANYIMEEFYLQNGHLGENINIKNKPLCRFGTQWDIQKLNLVQKKLFTCVSDQWGPPARSWPGWTPGRCRGRSLWRRSSCAGLRGRRRGTGSPRLRPGCWRLPHSSQPLALKQVTYLTFISVMAAQASRVFRYSWNCLILGMSVMCERDNEGGRRGICHLVCSYNPIWAAISAYPGLTLAQQNIQTNINQRRPCNKSGWCTLFEESVVICYICYTNQVPLFSCIQFLDYQNRKLICIGWTFLVRYRWVVVLL